MLQPREEIVLLLNPPLSPNEHPAVLTPNTGDVYLKDTSAASVTIVNDTDRIVVFLFTVIPSIVAKATSIPWAQVAEDLGFAVQNSKLLNSFARLFGK